MFVLRIMLFKRFPDYYSDPILSSAILICIPHERLM